MSTNLVLNVEPRTIGKHFSRSARKVNKIPTVIYGPKFKNANVFIDEVTVTRYRSPRFESSIFSLESGAKELSGLKVLIKNMQMHPMTGRPVHLDLYALDMTSKVRLKMVLEITGLPVGVKEEGGLLQVIMHDLEIECLPADIPTVIKVDVSHLALNDSLHVSDIEMPNGVRAVTAGERTVATVTLPEEEKAAVVATPDAAAAPAAAGAAKAPAAGAAKAPAAPAAKK
jgi:large subunit ribosomal protein L25